MMKYMNWKKTLTFVFIGYVINISSIMAAETKVALVSVFIDKNMTEGVNDDFLKWIMNDDYFEFDSLVNNFKDKFFNQYASELPVEFLGEDSVINAEGYQNLGSGITGSSRYATPAGYVQIDSRWGSKDKASINEAFSILPQSVDFIMVAYLNFKLVESATIDNVTFSKIEAYVNFKMMDRNGKQVVSIKERAKSIDRVMELSLGRGWSISDVHDLKPLCYQALHKLYEDLTKDLQKDSKKMNKKITKWRKKNL
jgi:hypothetical protein